MARTKTLIAKLEKKAKLEAEIAIAIKEESEEFYKEFEAVITKYKIETAKELEEIIQSYVAIQKDNQLQEDNEKLTNREGEPT